MLDSPDRLKDIIAGLQGLEGPLLPILHAVQAEWGHVPQAAIPVIAAIGMLRQKWCLASCRARSLHLAARTRQARVAKACDGPGRSREGRGD